MERDKSSNSINEWMHIIHTSSSSNDLEIVEKEEQEESWVALTPTKGNSGIDTIFETETLMRMLGFKRENNHNESPSDFTAAAEVWEAKCEKHKTPDGSPKSTKKATSSTTTPEPPVCHRPESDVSLSDDPTDSQERRLLRGLLRWWMPSQQQQQQKQQKQRATSASTSSFEKSKVPAGCSHPATSAPGATRFPSSVPGVRGRLQSDEMTEQSDDDDDDDEDEDEDEDDVIDENFLRMQSAAAYTLSSTL